jgi:hypothetical protein
MRERLKLAILHADTAAPLVSAAATTPQHATHTGDKPVEGVQQVVFVTRVVKHVGGSNDAVVAANDKLLQQLSA